jgi:RimJ/RimL family protein N-acetyltransferase
LGSYPAEYEVDAVITDGEVVQIRPIRPDDAEGLIRFFSSMGPESRYFRFFQIKQTLEPAEAEYFTTVDYRNRMALVALDDNEIIAVARYDRLADEPTVAEVAFMVADRHQGKGLASELLALLTSYARQLGVTSFRAFVLPENVQMMRVFRNSGYALSRTLEDGVYTVNFPVDQSHDSRLAEGGGGLPASDLLSPVGRGDRRFYRSRVDRLPAVRESAPHRFHRPAVSGQSHRRGGSIGAGLSQRSRDS